MDPSALMRIGSIRERRVEHKDKSLEFKIATRISTTRAIVEFEDDVLSRYNNVREFSPKLDSNMLYVIDNFLVAPPFDINNE